MLTKKSHTFRNIMDLDRRKIESQKVLDRHPNSRPVIVHSSSIDIKHQKYLIPEEITVHQFYSIFRKKTSLHPTEAIYMFIEIPGLDDSTIGQSIAPEMTKTFGSLYASFRYTDGFLYVHMEKESTFGQ